MFQKRLHRELAMLRLPRLCSTRPHELMQGTLCSIAALAHIGPKSNLAVCYGFQPFGLCDDQLDLTPADRAIIFCACRIVADRGDHCRNHNSRHSLPADFGSFEFRYGMSALLLRKARRPLRLGFMLTAPLLTVPRVRFRWLGAVCTAHYARHADHAGRVDVDRPHELFQRTLHQAVPVRYRRQPVARKHVTQLRVLKRAINIIIGLVTAGAVLLTFEGVQEYGLSLFAWPVRPVWSWVSPRVPCSPI